LAFLVVVYLRSSIITFHQTIRHAWQQPS
jgi:hypothetical protein